jgi:hypothetical protein
MTLKPGGSLSDDGQTKMKVAVLLPTTGALNRVVRIISRPDLEASTVFQTGSANPLSITKDYDFLVSKKGSLTALAPLVKPGPYWLLLSERIESGESWNVPVILGHVVHALDAMLVEDPRQADLVLWSTGAVDALLDVVGEAALRSDKGYRLEDKVERSRAALAQAAAAGVQIICFLPPGIDATSLYDLLADVGARDARVTFLDNVPAAVHVLKEVLDRAVPAVLPLVLPPSSCVPETSGNDSLPAASPAVPPPLAVAARRHAPGARTVAAAVFAVLAAVAGVTGLIVRPGFRGGPANEVHEMSPHNAQRPDLDEAARPGGPPGRESQPPPDGGAGHPDDAAPAVVPVRLREFRPANNGTCIPYILGRRTPPHTVDVTLAGPGTFRDSSGRNLCMLEWTLNPDAQGVQGFDIEPPHVPGIQLSGTGPVGTWTRVRVEFMRDFTSTSPILYTVRLKFNGAPPPNQMQQFQHTLKLLG